MASATALVVGKTRSFETLALLARQKRLEELQQLRHEQLETYEQTTAAAAADGDDGLGTSNSKYQTSLTQNTKHPL